MGYMSAKQVAEALGTNQTHVLEYARRKDDPLPLRYIKGKRNGEFDEWLIRNTCLYNERKEYA